MIFYFQFLLYLSGTTLGGGYPKKLWGAFASDGVEQFLEGVFGNFTQNVTSLLLQRRFVTFVRRTVILRVHTGQRKPEKPEKPGN